MVDGRAVHARFFFKAMKNELAAKANGLPLLPGVYLMKDEEGKVIYVGKAKKLKNRVSSYFHGEHNSKVSAMIRKIASFDVIMVSSELEALVLENSLIKQYKPRYNILLKDDKGYPFIRVDVSKEYPDITISSKKRDDQALYFGPFGGRKKSFAIISEVKRALCLPDCKKQFPRDIGSSRPCLNYHLKKCSGWCIPGKKTEEFRERIEQAIHILDGRTEELLNGLRNEMEIESSLLHFEKAAELRDRISFINSLSEHQLVLSRKTPDVDVIGFSRGAVSCFSVLRYVNGTLVDKQLQMIDEPVDSDEEAISAFIVQFYSGSDRRLPRTILAELPEETVAMISCYLSSEYGKKVMVEAPKRGEKRKVLGYASVNADEEMKRVNDQEQRQAGVLKSVMRLLKLNSFPERIEAYDISNLGNEGIVAAMTVFINGKPAKKEYRKFRIQGLTEQDDYASLAQCLERRFDRYRNMDPAFAILPDLMLIDGGAQHTRTAAKVAEQYGLQLNIFGMAKDDRHRTRALVASNGSEVSIKGDIEIFSLIGRIQEETHRSAITYQRNLRGEKFASRLDAIPGIGDKRKKILLERFKTVRAIRSASLEDLEKIIPSGPAAAVFATFHEERENTEE